MGSERYMFNSKEQQAMSKISGFKKFSLLSFGILLSSCATSSTKHRCELQMESLYGYKYFYKAFGVITQLNDCAIVDGIAPEIGAYYGARRAGVVSNLDSNGGGSLDAMGRYMGCPKEQLPLFTKVVIEKRDLIFGKDLENSDRAVTLKMAEVVRADEALSQLCNFSN